MLNDDEVAAMRAWVQAADRWAHSAQQLVGAATDLATVSRDIASTIAAAGREGEGGAADLQRLAVELESDTASLRDRYLATAANIDQYREVLE
jgi:hypothetical protein